MTDFLYTHKPLIKTLNLNLCCNVTDFERVLKMLNATYNRMKRVKKKRKLFCTLSNNDQNDPNHSKKGAWRKVSHTEVWSPPEAEWSRVRAM